MKIEQLNKSFGSVEVLKGIDLTISKGMIYGLVGENGSGKTTLFRCLVGLESYKGTIKLDDNNIDIGFLPSNPYVLPRLTGREYLQYLANSRSKGKLDFDTLNVFDLPLDRYMSAYSTGMKKKLAFLGVILQDNDLIILDEPFSGVDIQSNFILLETIKRLKENGNCILLSSHIFSTLANQCDMIFHLSEGRLSTGFTKENYDLLDGKIKDKFVGDVFDRLGL